MAAMINFAEKLLNKELKGFNVINLGTEEGISVTNSAKIICKTLKVSPKIIYTGGRQGWIGDNPVIKLDISKAKTLGWTPSYSIEQSIIETTKWVYSFLKKV